jgi:hypothetical protein
MGKKMPLICGKAFILKKAVNHESTRIFTNITERYTKN